MNIEPITSDRIVENIRRQGGEIFITLKGNALVGSYAIYICPNLTRAGRSFAVIENVISCPYHRRLGIGRKMMDHAKSYAKTHCCYKVYLQSGVKKKETHFFYEACGFTDSKKGFEVRL